MFQNTKKTEQMIPLCDLKRQYQSIKVELDSALLAAAAEAKYILGPNVGKLEKELADYCGVEQAVGVGSGTDALRLALQAIGVGHGDEVVTTAFSFVATSEAIAALGAKPVFTDIDPDTYNLDPKWAAAAVTPRTKAILPVHIFGQPCDMDALMRLAASYDLPLVEDCAQAIGARYRGRFCGSFGAAGCLSFFPSKNLGCCGDGGMILSGERRLAERAESLRRHGGRVKYHHDELGCNSRLDELQAAVLRVKLPHLARWQSLRRCHAYHYNRLFADVREVRCPRELSSDGPFVPRDAQAADDGGVVECVYHQYTIQVDDRDELSRRLKERGIASAVYYPLPLHLQKLHANLGCRPGSLPHTEQACRRCLSLPIFPELSEAEVETVAAAVRESIAAMRGRCRSRGIELEDRPAA